MKNTHEIFLISDSTGETIDRIFTALKAQFKDFSYKTQQFSFTRTENQISEILKEAKTKKKYNYSLYFGRSKACPIFK